MAQRLPSKIAAALVVFAFATPSACKGTKEPVQPPAQVGPSATPRFDGIYAAKVQGGAANAATPDVGVDLLRFTEDGHVSSLSAASIAALEPAVRALLAQTDRAANGTYAIKDGVLRFTLTSKLGSVAYAGAVKDNQLTVRWRSDINDVATEETFDFVKVEDEAPSEPARPEGNASADEDAGTRSVPPPGTVSPEPMLIPQGREWACFRAPAVNTSRCERTSAACEAAYKSAASARPDLKLTRCMKRANAFCHTAMNPTSNRGRGFCYLSEDECKAGVAGFDGNDLVISACAKF